MSESVKKYHNCSMSELYLISKIKAVDAKYILFYNVPLHRKSKILVCEDDRIPPMMKMQRTMKKLMYALFFRYTKLVTPV